MKAVLILIALVLSLPSIAMAEEEKANPRLACEAASLVLKDMRYVEGKTAAPRDFSHPKAEARLQRCMKVALLAAPHGEKVMLASIAIAYNETNFRSKVKGSAGEVGMMQVMPKHHCKPYKDLNNGSGGCTNPELAGVRLIRFLLNKYSINRSFRYYNGGQKYADKVEVFFKVIRRSYHRQQVKLAKR